MKKKRKGKRRERSGGWGGYIVLLGKEGNKGFGRWPIGRREGVDASKGA